VYKPEDTALALLGFLSYNNQNQSQFNAVGVQQEKWTGWDLNPRPQLLSLETVLSLIQEGSI
jgi:hypothetical protein